MKVLRAVGVVVLMSGGCSTGEDALPAVRVRATPEACLDPLPPPAFVLRSGADPSKCLPKSALAAGVVVSVRVSSDGRAVSVSQLYDLCLTVGPGGKTFDPYTLNGEDQRCILEALRDWELTGVRTCWPVTAVVSLGGSCQDPDAAAECEGA